MQRYILFLLLLVPYIGQASDSLVTGPKPSRLFPALIMDPMETQIYGTITRLSPNATFDYPVYCPFALGCFLTVRTRSNYQIGIDAIGHTQFGFREENTIYMHGIRKSYLNSDYVLGCSYSRKINERWRMKVSLAHQSSHLGDDHILLTGISGRNYWKTDPSSFETMQIAALYSHSFLNLYAKITGVVRPDPNRKRMQYQAGAFFSGLPLKNIFKKTMAGIDISVLENNEYIPGIKAGIGYSCSDRARVMAEYYVGPIPYSRYQSFLNINWVGLGLYIDPVL